MSDTKINYSEATKGYHENAKIDEDTMECVMKASHYAALLEKEKKIEPADWDDLYNTVLDIAWYYLNPPENDEDCDFWDVTESVLIGRYGAEG